jgi:hypothetical protein
MIENEYEDIYIFPREYEYIHGACIMYHEDVSIC